LQLLTPAADVNCVLALCLDENQNLQYVCIPIVTHVDEVGQRAIDGDGVRALLWQPVFDNDTPEILVVRVREHACSTIY